MSTELDKRLDAITDKWIKDVMLPHIKKTQLEAYTRAITEAQAEVGRLAKERSGFRASLPRDLKNKFNSAEVFGAQVDVLREAMARLEILKGIEEARLT